MLIFFTDFNDQTNQAKMKINSDYSRTFLLKQFFFIQIFLILFLGLGLEYQLSSPGHHILRSFRILKYTFQGTVPNFSGKYFSSQKSVNILLLNNESSYSTYLKGESTVHI